VYAGGVPQQALELVHLRASQVNGCSACIDAGAKSATKAGVSPEKLLTVAAWYEITNFLQPSQRGPPRASRDRVGLTPGRRPVTAAVAMA
jgi:AhpD family alkylhydroperoxidase